MKTQFLAYIGHELRTPLTLILGPVRQFLVEENLTSLQLNTLGYFGHHQVLRLISVKEREGKPLKELKYILT